MEIVRNIGRINFNAVYEELVNLLSEDHKFFSFESTVLNHKVRPELLQHYQKQVQLRCHIYSILALT